MSDEKTEPLIGMDEARGLVPKGIGYSTMRHLFTTYGWKLGAKRSFMPRTTFFSWLRGEISLSRITYRTVLERRAREKAADQAAEVAKAVKAEKAAKAAGKSKTA